MTDTIFINLIRACEFIQTNLNTCHVHPLIRSIIHVRFIINEGNVFAAIYYHSDEMIHHIIPMPLLSSFSKNIMLSTAIVYSFEYNTKTNSIISLYVTHRIPPISTLICVDDARTYTPSLLPSKSTQLGDKRSIDLNSNSYNLKGRVFVSTYIRNTWPIETPKRLVMKMHGVNLCLIQSWFINLRFTSIQTPYLLSEIASCDRKNKDWYKKWDFMQHLLLGALKWDTTSISRALNNLIICGITVTDADTTKFIIQFYMGFITSLNLKDPKRDSCSLSLLKGLPDNKNIICTEVSQIYINKLHKSNPIDLIETALHLNQDAVLVALYQHKLYTGKRINTLCASAYNYIITRVESGGMDVLIVMHADILLHGQLIKLFAKAYYAKIHLILMANLLPASPLCTLAKVWDSSFRIQTLSEYLPYYNEQSSGVRATDRMIWQSHFILTPANIFDPIYDNLNNIYRLILN